MVATKEIDYCFQDPCRKNRRLDVGARVALCELSLFELGLELVELLDGERLRDGDRVVGEVVLRGAGVAAGGEAAREALDRAEEEALALV